MEKARLSRPFHLTPGHHNGFDQAEEESGKAGRGKMNMSYLIAYFSTVSIFLVLDVIGLTYLIRPVFERDVGALLLSSPKLGAAAVFYLFYITGVVWFVVAPALRDGAPVHWVFLQAAFLGALCYGTYEFTNLATLKGWSWRMVATDLTWGTLLTGVSAAGGYLAARTFSGTG